MMNLRSNRHVGAFGALAMVTLLAMGPVAVQAKDAAGSGAAMLVADAIDFTGGAAMLTARGNVEVFYKGVQLRAGQITYDRVADSLQVMGPITLLDGSDTVIFADYAQLSPDLRQGMLQGARLVLDQQLQIAATEISRSADGRYTQAYQTVASSCTVCAANPVPLWQIRSKRVIHDTQERQLYFEQAQFRIAGVPVLYLPQLRMPDPTLERSSGFLPAEIISNDQLGTGIKTPYFIAIDPHRDLTLTPYLSTGGTRTIEGRYRQAFTHGDIRIDAALSDDDLNVDPWRGYVFATGTFQAARDYVFSFDIEAVSDPAYLLTYDISDKDRLQSRAAVSRVNRDEFTEAEIIAFRSLRAADDNRFLPTIMSTVGTTRRFVPASLGGIAKAGVEAHGYLRTGDDPLAGLSRDVTRLSVSTEWARSWIWSSGLVTTLQAEGHIDRYQILQDPAFPDNQVTRATPYLGFEARLPLARSTAGGVTHVLEPVLQVIVAPDTLKAVPNEDSITVEFDEGNLFSASRFAGRDGRELGNRLNFGLNYTRIDPAGWTLGLTLGRVVRQSDRTQFNAGTGLDGKSSDWLAAVQLALGEGFTLMQRGLFDDQFTFSRAETLLYWTYGRGALTSGYTWLQADPPAGRPIDTSEWTMDASLDLAGDWTGRVDWRYDFVTDKATRAGVGLTYLSDCVKVDFDVSRRFTSTAALQPATTVGLSVGLTGFGAGNDGKRGAGRTCSY
jgi:LPS-assembly protein